MSSPEMPTIPEEDPNKKLNDFVHRSSHIPPPRKGDLAEHHVFATPDELRTAAEAVEKTVRRALSLDHIPNSVHAIVSHQREYAALLRDAADHGERNDQELGPEEAVKEAKEIYEKAREEAQEYRFSDYVESKLSEPRSRTDLQDPQKYIEFCIARCEDDGSAAGKLVAFHERHGNMSEIQRLASLAINRFHASNILRRHARNAEMAYGQDDLEPDTAVEQEAPSPSADGGQETPPPDTTDEQNALLEKPSRNKVLQLQLERSREMRNDYRVLAAAVEVLRGSGAQE